MTEDSRLVFRSSSKSVAADAISVVAVLEIAFAVMAYWALWEKFGIHTHLWLSIFVAPVLLLRSDASVARGIRWAEQYMSQPFVDAHNLDKRLFVQIFVWQFVRPFLGICAAYFVLVSLLPMATTWANVLTGLFLGYLLGQFYMAISTAVLPQELLIMSQRLSYVIAGISGALIATVVVALLAQPGVTASISFVFGSTITIMSAFMLAIRSKFFVDHLKRAEYPAQVVGTLPAWFAIFAPGMLLGGWMRSLLIRVLATLRHLPEGVAALPVNWFRTLFVYDIFVPPEIIPGYWRDDFYNVRFYIDRINQADTRWRKALYIAGAVLFFAPAYIYRMSIKSTFWLYYGLAFVVTGAQFVHGHIRGEVSMSQLRDAPKVLVDVVENDPRAKLRWTMIWVGIAVLLLSNLLVIITKANSLPFKIPFPLEYLVLIDYSSIKVWQVIGLIVAALTMMIYINTRHLETYVRHSKRHPWLRDPVRSVTRRLVLLLRLRNIASRTLVLVIAVHALLWLSPAQRYLPERFLGVLRQIYGESMPPIPTERSLELDILERYVA